MASNTSSAVQMAYRKKAFTQFCLSFHNDNDREIIQRLQTVANKNDYIRPLIRQDIGRMERESLTDNSETE